LFIDLNTLVLTEKMSEKLETAEELYALFCNEEKLKAYRYSQPVVCPEGVTNETFYLDLPYEEIKSIVEEKRDAFLEKLPEDVRSKVVWEHVGSTSIKGMPGTKFPDALLIVPEFPPSKDIIQAFLDNGYYFSQAASHLDPKDLWFFFVFTDGILKYHKLTVHVVPPKSRSANILLDTRDMCRNEEWAFEDYKTVKIEAAKGESFREYKEGKGRNSKLLKMLQEKYPASLSLESHP